MPTDTPGSVFECACVLHMQLSMQGHGAPVAHVAGAACRFTRTRLNTRTSHRSSKTYWPLIGPGIGEARSACTESLKPSQPKLSSSISLTKLACVRCNRVRIAEARVPLAPPLAPSHGRGRRGPHTAGAEGTGIPKGTRSGLSGVTALRRFVFEYSVPHRIRTLTSLSTSRCG